MAHHYCDSLMCSGQKWVGQGPPMGASPDWLPVAIKQIRVSSEGRQEMATLERVQHQRAYHPAASRLIRPVESFQGCSFETGGPALFLITR